MSDDTLTDMLMCKYNFKSNWINFSTTYSFNIDKLDLYTGFHMYGYNRKHFGNEGTFTYDNVGDKRDFSPFVKLFYKMKSVNLYCDVQYRKNEYFYLDYINYFEKLKYNFINYSIGASYNLKKGTLYYSFSKSNREPCRSDILGGVEYYIPDYANVKLKPESVYDNEFGFRINIDKINFNVNLYYMKFKNELSLNGKIGPTGVPLHENVDNSFRSGLEIDFKYIADNITITNNISYNYSRIKQGDINIRPILTPTLIFNQDINYKYDWFSLGLIGKIQSWSYIDVANKNIISDYFILNSYIGAKWGSGVEFMYYMNNITGTEYFANGVMSNTDKPLYFVGSPFNWFFALKINI
jgi:iron complex outermembrane receptor protein